MSTLPVLSVPYVAIGDPDDITGLQTGDQCDLLPDRAQFRDWQQPTASRRPIFTASNPNANGHASLTFDGLDDFMEQVLTRSNLIDRRTVVFIGRVFGDADGQAWVDGTTATTQGRMYYSTNSTANGLTSGFAGAGRIDYGARLTTPQMQIAMFTTGIQMWAIQNDGAKVLVNPNSSAQPLGLLRLGAQHDLTAYANFELYLIAAVDGPMSDADIATVKQWRNETYVSGAPVVPNAAPTAPAAFTEPVAGSTSTGLDLVSHGGSTDPDGDPVTYEFELTTNGGTSWVSKRTGVALPYFDYDYSAETPTATAKWRSRASDGALTSAWTESGTFTIGATAAPTRLPRYVWGLDGVRRPVTGTYHWTPDV